MKRFIGREAELADLGELWRKPGARLVTCRGRRRIGKSTLFEEFARRSGAAFVKIEGLAPHAGMANAEQLSSFAGQLALQADVAEVVPDSWLKAFKMLDSALPSRKRTLVLLDEISWMGAFDMNFPGALKVAWDNWFSHRDNLMLVLCGSVSAWISDNILHNTGFVGRRSADILLEELPLGDCVEFWGKAAARTSVADIVDVLSVTGGVPRYLEEIDPALSADENIRRLCLVPKGMLFNEFEELFDASFGERAEARKSILQALASGAKTGSEIAEITGRQNNGHFADWLEELEIAGFTARDAGVNPETGRPARIASWRIRDNYTRFYLRCIEPNRSAIRENLFSLFSPSALPGWNSIIGLQFESLVLSNVRRLLPLMGLDRTLVLSCAPWRKAASVNGKGCQIDLLVQTARSITVVEIKRRAEIDGSVVSDVEEKVKSVPRCGKSVRTALVYAGHLSPVVERDGFFDFVIPVEKLLRGG